MLLVWTTEHEITNFSEPPRGGVKRQLLEQAARDAPKGLVVVPRQQASEEALEGAELRFRRIRDVSLGFTLV